MIRSVRNRLHYVYRNSPPQQLSITHQASLSSSEMEVLGDLPPGYDDLSAKAKQNLLWTKISNSRYKPSELPNTAPGVLQFMKLLNPWYLKKSFTYVSDELPTGRAKIIHPYGSAAKVELRVFPDSPFSGLFKSGGSGIARLSIATPDTTQFTPGMALKLLVDGQRSQNFHIMYKLDGQGSNRNIFEHSFTNIIPAPSSFVLKILAKAFSFALKLLPGSQEDAPESEVNMPLYQAASVESDGGRVGSVVAPYLITFTPNSTIGWDPTTATDFRVHLADVPAGTVLYTVSGRRTMGAADEAIGELVAQSPFAASQYGDERLFFQHATRRWQASL